MDRLRPQLVSYRDESGRELFDVPDGVFAAAETRASPRFLPQYDNILLSHEDRSRIAGDRRLDGDFAWKGSILLDGFLTGRWRLRSARAEAVLTVELDRSPDRPTRAQLEEEGERLLRFLTPTAKNRKLKLS
jgi:Winged helix DNA-binding domain